MYSFFVVVVVIIIIIIIIKRKRMLGMLTTQAARQEHRLRHAAVATERHFPLPVIHKFPFQEHKKNPSQVSAFEEHSTETTA
jgi:hypothetical protein